LRYSPDSVTTASRRPNTIAFTTGVNTAVYIPGNSYIVIPKESGYEVLWRYQGKSLEHSRRQIPGQTMRDHFFDMLKKRAK
jgi:hypothetical protein